MQKYSFHSKVSDFKKFLGKYTVPLQAFLMSFLVVTIILLLAVPNTNIGDFFLLLLLSIIAVPLLFIIFSTSPIILIVLGLIFIVPIAFFLVAVKVKNLFLSIFFAMLSGGLFATYVFGSVYIVGHGG